MAENITFPEIETTYHWLHVYYICTGKPAMQHVDDVALNLNDITR